LILAAIIVLGASGFMLMLLGIAFPRLDDDDPSAPSDERVPPRVTIRREGVMPALTPVRLTTEARGTVSDDQKPSRRSAGTLRIRRGYAKGLAYFRTGRSGVPSTSPAVFLGVVALSCALGLLIAHI
jgi:hypothetical protein